MAGGRLRRQAEVELALVRGAGEVNQSALAREFGVSRWTIRRDIEAVWARRAALLEAGGESLAEEWSATAALLELIAREALGQYGRLARKTPGHTAAVGYLRTALMALERRAKLLGLADARPEAAGTLQVVVEHVYPEGAEPILVRPPGGWPEGEGPEA